MVLQTVTGSLFWTEAVIHICKLVLPDESYDVTNTECWIQFFSSLPSQSANVSFVLLIY